jgi:GDPmannose 4,6-dehydratase
VKTALITGISGQDGAYLARHLRDIGGYDSIVGVVRHKSSTNGPPERLVRLGVQNDIKLVDGDVTDITSLIRILDDHVPDEIYNLAAQSFVGVSWGQPIVTTDITGMGCLRMLEALRITNAKNARFYQASSSEMFGVPDRGSPQTEQTPFHPRSPYGTAKAMAHHSTINYRESYGIHASCGILFNHESPLRGTEFVTRKITLAAAMINAGKQDELVLGNLIAERDWGHARDFVRAMHLILQQSEPDDYVIATGKIATVLDVVRIAFEHFGLDHNSYVRSLGSNFRAADVPYLRGDSSKAARKFGWTASVTLEAMITEMCEADARYITGDTTC